ncbi:MAG TPA: FliH/SctL family protein [Ramlibacter sp.]|nr:FliH/SctL family protein [Ramlibacter sp.]
MSPTRRHQTAAQPVLRQVELDARPHLLKREGVVHRPVGGLTAPKAAQTKSSAEAPIVPLRRDVDVELSQAESRARDEEARRSSFEQARAEGLLQGRREAQAEVAQLKLKADKMAAEATAAFQARFQQILHGASTQSRAYVAEAEDELVAVVHAAVCRILGAVAPNAAVVRALTRQLIETHHVDGDLRVHLHPGDLAALGPAPQTEDRWEWVADSTVQMGGVILRRKEGGLDARLESQLEALRVALIRTRDDRKAAAALAGERAQQGAHHPGSAGRQE